MGPVPNDLKNLNDVVDKDVVTKDVHDELVKSVNAIDISKLLKQIAMLRPKVLLT